MSPDQNDHADAAGPAIHVADLVKRYGSHAALDGVSFSLRRGQFVALLGPNGAGKSTLFQVLSGLFAADAGDVAVMGHSLRAAPSAALRHLGVVFQQVSLDLDLTVARNLHFAADLQGLPRRLANERIAQDAPALGLDALLTRKVRELSGGQRRKVELLRAGLHRPAVMLMDEATVGLDAASRRDLLAELHRRVRDEGLCVLWATHWVEEVDGAQRVLVLHRGKLLADGGVADVTAALGGATLQEGFLARTQPARAAAAA